MGFQIPRTGFTLRDSDVAECWSVQLSVNTKPGVILSKFTPRSDHVMYIETAKSQELELREYRLQLTFNETLNLKGLDGTIRKGVELVLKEKASSF